MADRPETTGARVRYHGEVLSQNGEDFLTIESEEGGYAPLVTVTIDTNGSALINLYLSPDQAAELSRHLKNAAAGL